LRCCLLGTRSPYSGDAAGTQTVSKSRKAGQTIGNRPSHGESPRERQ
jgi:hypothetical protein